MGWLWSFPASSTDNGHLPLHSQNLGPSKVSPSQSPSSLTKPPAQPMSGTSSQPVTTTSTAPIDEPSPELSEFLTALRPPPPKPTHNPTTTHSPSFSTTPLLPHHIYPTTLSCRTAFDTAFYCSSFGGQFTSLYRYGALRSCSQQWSDFWFCVRTNRGLYNDKEREMRVLKREWEKEREKYRGGKGEVELGVGVVGGKRGVSSEDVWEQRGELVRGAFEGDYWAAVEENRVWMEREKEKEKERARVEVDAEGKGRA